MYPRALGSVQPLRPVPVSVPGVSPSAPQLTVPAPRGDPRPVPVLQDSCPVTLPKPQACTVPLMTPDQLRVVESLSADRAMSHITGCLPSDIPQQHANSLTVLLYTVFRWAVKNQMDYDKISALFTVYFDTYKFFLASPWRTQGQVYGFLKESLLRVSVDHIPLSRRVLTPAECRASLTHFCRACLPVLPLLRMTVAPNHRLDLRWTSHHDERLVDMHVL